YLQSRYYNPEWGRFINADGIAASVGVLLSDNVFAYCNNNSVNMDDNDGYRPNYICNDGGEIGVAGDSIGSTFSKISNNTGTIIKKFDYKSSAIKGTKSGIIDKVGEIGSATLIKGKKVYEELGTCTLGKYVSKFSGPAKFGKKALGLVGTIGFTTWDVGHDLIKGEYVSAGIDFASGIVGALGGMAVTAGAPVLLIGGIVFGASVGVGVLIDRYTTSKKDEYYGR
uniref:RHS repeat-associated core domain-containing protein n=1 Tax=Clostridium sp. C8-1-8 TaxID=2698831 RepID=UPI0013689FA8